MILNLVILNSIHYGNNGPYRYMTAVINALECYGYNVIECNDRNGVLCTIHGRNNCYFQNNDYYNTV